MAGAAWFIGISAAASIILAATTTSSPGRHSMILNAVDSVMSHRKWQWLHFRGSVDMVASGSARYFIVCVLEHPALQVDIFLCDAY